MLLSPDGRLVDGLLEFAARHGIATHDQMTPQALSDVMQRCWVRKEDHQYQIPAGPPMDDDYMSLRQLGMVDAIQAPRGQFGPFQGALILGGTLLAVRKRLLYFIRQCELFDIQLSRVYMLGGARMLDVAKESPEALSTPMVDLPFKDDWKPPATFPALESDMMQLVFEQSQMPKWWSGFYVHTPKKLEGDNFRNPNTTDTVMEWLQRMHPSFGDYLVISSQPYVNRQLLNVQAAAGPLYRFFGVGYEAPTSISLAAFLDEMARLLFEELKQQQK